MNNPNAYFQPDPNESLRREVANACEFDGRNPYLEAERWINQFPANVPGGCAEASTVFLLGEQEAINQQLIPSTPGPGPIRTYSDFQRNAQSIVIPGYSTSVENISPNNSRAIEKIIKEMDYRRLLIGMELVLPELGAPRFEKELHMIAALRCDTDPQELPDVLRVLFSPGMPKPYWLYDINGFELNSDTSVAKSNYYPPNLRLASRRLLHDIITRYTNPGGNRTNGYASNTKPILIKTFTD